MTIIQIRHRDPGPWVEAWLLRCMVPGERGTRDTGNLFPVTAKRGLQHWPCSKGADQIGHKWTWLRRLGRIWIYLEKGFQPESGDGERERDIQTDREKGSFQTPVNGPVHSSQSVPLDDNLGLSGLWDRVIKYKYSIKGFHSVYWCQYDN